MTSLTKDARIAGALYILASVVGVVRLIYIPQKLIVSGNAAATAGKHNQTAWASSGRS